MLNPLKRVEGLCAPDLRKDLVIFLLPAFPAFEVFFGTRKPLTDAIFGLLQKHSQSAKILRAPLYSSTEKLFRQRLPNARGLHDVALHLDDPLGFFGEATTPVKLAVQSLPDKNLLQHRSVALVGPDFHWKMGCACQATQILEELCRFQHALGCLLGAIALSWTFSEVYSGLL